MASTRVMLQVLRNARPVTTPSTHQLTAGAGETWIHTYPGQENSGDSLDVCLFDPAVLGGWWTARALIQVNGINIAASRPIRWFGEATGCGWTGITHWPLLDTRPDSSFAGYFSLAIEAA